MIEVEICCVNEKTTEIENIKIIITKGDIENLAQNIAKEMYRNNGFNKFYSDSVILKITE